MEAQDRQGDIYNQDFESLAFGVSSHVVVVVVLHTMYLTKNIHKFLTNAPTKNIITKESGARGKKVFRGFQDSSVLLLVL